MSDSSDPWTAAYQAPPSMGFSRQKYWSGVPLPSPHTSPEKAKFCLQLLLPFLMQVHCENISYPASSKAVLNPRSTLG